MNIITKVVLAIVGMAAATTAHASSVKSVIVYKACGSRYVAENTMGYVLIEWFGGVSPNKGDLIIGDINGFGFKDVYDLTQDNDLRVWVDDYMLSRQRVIDKVVAKCP